MGEEANKGVLEYRIASLELSVNEIRTAVKSIDNSLQTLARLETHHADTRESLGRAFADIKDHETRLRVLEEQAPTLKLTHGWIITGVLGVLSLVGIAIVGMLLGTPGV